MNAGDFKALKKAFNQSVFKMFKENTINKLYNNIELEQSIKIIFNENKKNKPRTDNLLNGRSNN